MAEVGAVPGAQQLYLALYLLGAHSCGGEARGQCLCSKQMRCTTSEGPVHRTLLCLQQENVIQTMELRNYFSLYCLHQETQLVHVYLPLTSHILGAFVNSQIQGHKEVSHPCSHCH